MNKNITTEVFLNHREHGGTEILIMNMNVSRYWNHTVLETELAGASLRRPQKLLKRFIRGLRKRSPYRITIFINFSVHSVVKTQVT